MLRLYTKPWHRFSPKRFATTPPKALQRPLATHNLTFPTSRHLHFSPLHRHKIFTDSENAFAYTVLPPLINLAPSWGPASPITTLQGFEQILDQNWRSSSASAIVRAFEKVKDFSVSHGVPLSDRRFDKLVDGLMDHCEHLTDLELLKLLVMLSNFPPCESPNSHNFHDVWSCLDDICCWKMSEWDLETMFLFANAWYQLNLGRVSDYVFEVLDKASAKAGRMSKSMILYTFFYVNVCRRKAVAFEFEHVLAKRIHEFGVDELGIVAMGYFKTRSRIKLKGILSAMIEAVRDNCEGISEISLTAMLKAIRLTQNIDSVEEITSMLDNLTKQIPNLSNLALVHLALVGTGLQLKHAPSLKQCIQRISDDIENIRLKDIERTLLAASMFDVDANPSFFTKAFKELHKASRRPEIVQYNRCLPCALNYLSLRKIYSYELSNEVLDEDYINTVYGKSSRSLPRELFSLDTCLEIECPDYKGHRLSPEKKYKAAKWLSEFTPTLDQFKRLSTSDKYYLDVVEHVVKVVGDARLVRSDHVLPHFSKSDVIVCKDRSGGFVEPKGFENYVLGDVKWAMEGFEWFAVVVMTPNLTVRGACLPLGGMVMKGRQLEAVGYKPIFIYWNEFSQLSPPDKTSFISQRLR